MRHQIAQDIEADPVGTYRQHRGHEADLLERVPAHVRAGIARYVLLGVPTGSFLQAVFEDDLAGAIRRADESCHQALNAFLLFRDGGCPAKCWGSRDHVQEWIERRGLIGRSAADRIGNPCA